MGDFREFIEHTNAFGGDDVEQQIISMYRDNAKIEDIKQATKASVGKIYRTLESFGLKGNRFRKDHNKIRYYNDIWGLPVDQIAGFTKYSPRWVREVLKRDN